MFFGVDQWPASDRELPATQREYHIWRSPDWSVGTSFQTTCKTSLPPTDMAGTRCICVPGVIVSIGPPPRCYQVKPLSVEKSTKALSPTMPGTCVLYAREIVPLLSRASFRVSPQARPCQSIVEPTLTPRLGVLSTVMLWGISWRLTITRSTTASVVTARARFFPWEPFGFSGCEFKPRLRCLQLFKRNPARFDHSTSCTVRLPRSASYTCDPVR